MLLTAAIAVSRCAVALLRPAQLQQRAAAAVVAPLTARRPLHVLTSARPSFSLTPPSSLLLHHRRRTMFISSQETPNPASLMFLPGVKVLEKGTLYFENAKDAKRSPLVKRLFRVEGVRTVMLGTNFITVTKTDEVQWPILKPDIFATIMDFFASGHPVVDESADGDVTTLSAADASTAANSEDDEIVAMIKELLETRIRPVVQDDGGDIEYRGFENGIVKIKMVGSCSTCPSSTATLKGGVENLLMHYVPEVMGVESVVDEGENLSKQELEAVEAKEAQSEQQQQQQQQQQQRQPPLQQQ